MSQNDNIGKWEAKRYAIYEEYSTKGTINGQTVTLADLRKSRIASKSRVLWPVQEEKLIQAIQDLRKVGEKVSGAYIKAKIREFVRADFANASSRQLCKEKGRFQSFRKMVSRIL